MVIIYLIHEKNKTDDLFPEFITAKNDGQEFVENKNFENIMDKIVKEPAGVLPQKYAENAPNMSILTAGLFESTVETEIDGIGRVGTNCHPP